MTSMLSLSSPLATGISLRPLHPGFGAEVLGLDLAAPFPPRCWRCCTTR